MIAPLTYNFEVRTTGTFDAEIDFYSDAGRTIPFNFSSWTGFEFTVYTKTGTVAGTVSESGGKVTFGLTSDQTATISPQIARYSLAVIRGSAPVEREFLAVGRFTIKAPKQS